MNESRGESVAVSVEISISISFASSLNKRFLKSASYFLGDIGMINLSFFPDVFNLSNSDQCSFGLGVFSFVLCTIFLAYSVFFCFVSFCILFIIA